MAVIKFSNVSKRYLSGVEAVKNFNLEIKDGEFVVIVGASGCGKSTILRMVAGLEDITTGELKIDEKIVNDLEPKKRNVSMVFQNYALFPNLTVEGNIEFALKIQKVPKKERKERVLEMAKKLDIVELLNRKAKGLSGGQCQRIAIGRALVCKPSIFLLDEPLSNLDASMRNELRIEIARMQKELNVTTLYVTHDLTEAITLGNRIVVMNKGEIQQADTPQNVYSKPQNIYVAKFFGDNNINLFDARYEETDGKLKLVFGNIAFELPKWKEEALVERDYVGKNVIVGIRSEDAFIENKNVNPLEINTIDFEAEIESIEVLGAEKRIHLDANGVKISTLVSTYDELNIGQVVNVKIAIDKLHLFDCETNNAIVH